jgi:hypothetical protein
VAQAIHDGRATTFQRARRLLESERIAAEPRPLPDGPSRVIVADPPRHDDKREDDASKREDAAPGERSGPGGRHPGPAPSHAPRATVTHRSRIDRRWAPANAVA